MQAKGEKLRDYIHRFNHKRLDIDDYSDNIVIATFTNGLRDRDLVKSLYKRQPKSFDDVMTRAKAHMLAKEAIHSLSDETKDPLG